MQNTPLCKIITFLFFGVMLILYSCSDYEPKPISLKQDIPVDSIDNWVSKKLKEATKIRKNDSRLLAIDFLKNTLKEVWWANNPDEDYYVGKIYYYLGVYSKGEKKYNEAKHYLEKTRKISEIDGQKISKKSGRTIYKELASIYTREGDNKRAIELLRIAVDSSRIERDTLGIGRACLEWGTALFDYRKYEEAIDKYEEGLKYVKYSNNGKVITEKANLLVGKASCLSELGKMDEAFRFIQEGLVIMNSPKAIVATSYYIDAMAIQAAYYLKKGEIKKAKSFYQEAFDLAKDYYPKESREIAKLELELGSIALEEQKYGIAKEYCQSALTRVTPGFSDVNPKKTPSKTLFSDLEENTILEALELKGQIFYNLYQQNPSEIELLSIAQECLMRAIDMEDLLVESYIYQSSKLFNLQESRYRYSLLMTILYDTYHLTSKLDQPEILDTIFHYFEKSRAVLFNQRLASNQVEQEQEDSLFIEKKVLRNKIVRLTEEIVNASSSDDKEKAIKLGQDLLKLKEEEGVIRQQIEAAYPAYGNYEIPSITTVQEKLLMDSSLFLSYFVDEDYIYSVSFTKKGMPQFSRNKNAKVVEVISEKWLTPIRKSYKPSSNEKQIDQFNNFVNFGASLYQQLLLDSIVTQNISEITIIPDNFLSYIPFDLLFTQKVDSISSIDDLNYKALPYLFQKYAIGYDFSATSLWGNSNKSKGIEFKRDFLGLAPDYTTYCNNRLELVSNKYVERLADFLGGKYISPEDAKIELFKSCLTNTKVVYFHGHAGSIRDAPEQSWLALTPSQKINCSSLRKPDKLKPHAIIGHLSDLLPAEKTGYMRAYGINDLTINTQLLVLNSCYSGDGVLADGEGVLSLGRDFLMAGSSSVLMNAWKAHDDYSGELIELFFKHLKNGKVSKAKALQLARKKLLDKEFKNSAAILPSNLGVISVYGNNQPIQIEAQGFWDKYFAW